MNGYEPAIWPLEEVSGLEGPVSDIQRAPLARCGFKKNKTQVFDKVMKNEKAFSSAND